MTACWPWTARPSSSTPTPRRPSPSPPTSTGTARSARSPDAGAHARRRLHLVRHGRHRARPARDGCSGCRCRGCPGCRCTPTTAVAACCARWSPTTSTDLRDQGAALSGLHAAEVAIYGRFGYAVASAEVEPDPRPRDGVRPRRRWRRPPRAVRTTLVEADSDETAGAAAGAAPALRRHDPRRRDPARPDDPLRARGPAAVPAGARDRQGPVRVGGRAADRLRPVPPHGHAGSDDGLPQGTVTRAGDGGRRPGVAAGAGPAAGRLRPHHDDPDRRPRGRRPDDLVGRWPAHGPDDDARRALAAAGRRRRGAVAARLRRRRATWCSTWRTTVVPVEPAALAALRAARTASAGASPPRTRADLRLPVQALAAAYLGTRTLLSQARGGVLEELTPGSLWRPSRALSDDRQPVGAVMF